MSEIDVEAVESLDTAPIDAPEYVLYGGKGGVGKTTMAAATALASAEDGVPTLVVSTDPAHSLSDILQTPIPAEPGQIRDDIPLYAAEIDPEAMSGGPFGEGGATLGGLEQLLGGDVSGAMPGADEAAAMQLLLRYMDDTRFERVVVDTAPTGHTLRLLELPDVMETMVGRIMALKERFSGMLGSLGGMFGAGGMDEEDIDEGMDDLRTLSQRVERLRDALQDPSRTDFRVVMIPEEMSVLESERLIARLGEFGIPVGTVIVNRVMQPLAEVAEVDPEWFVSPDLENCEFCQRRWNVQRGALQKAQNVFRGHTVKRVPLFADEVAGDDVLRVVAACLR
ncbi:ArsA family ATPase [Natronomonas sp. EA1]|uniref:ArsA family ATPase n=1 Tax=Natronomonas sp. EA1 TaxID=3421655 RepID=UPI003EB800D8